MILDIKRPFFVVTSATASKGQRGGKKYPAPLKRGFFLPPLGGRFPRFALLMISITYTAPFSLPRYFHPRFNYVIENVHVLKRQSLIRAFRAVL
jgi:hypothetical protein